MANLRYIIRLIKAFVARFKGVLFLSIGFGIISFFFFSFLSPRFLGKRVERVGLTGRYNINSLPEEVLNLVGEGLTKLDKTGAAEPALATSWSSPDKGKTWVFTIRDDAFWQDGKRVTSKDINYSFSDVTVTKPDEKTIVFELKDAFSPFPTVVSKPIFKKGLLSTGEWEVKKAVLESGDTIQSLTLQDKKGNTKIFKFFPTEERTKLAFKLGEVDQVKNIFNKSPFETWNTVKVTEDTEVSQVVAVFFNTQDQFLADKSVRQGLDYAINKAMLGKSRAISPISPLSWAYNPQVKEYTYSTERAKELLGDEEMEIRLATSPVLLDVAEAIKRDWEEVGVKTIVQVSSSIPEDFQAYLAIFDMPKDPDQYSLWHSTQTGTNISQFSNPRIDKLLEDGRTEVNQEERRKIFLDFQRFLVEDLPSAFLYHPTTYTIERL